MLNNTQLQHFRNLISLAAADGEVKEIERVTLSKIAFDRGIPLDRLNIMLERANEYIYLIPQNQTDKEQQLRDMLDLALADGEFAQAEAKLIKMVGKKLGFSEENIENLIESHLARFK